MSRPEPRKAERAEADASPVTAGSDEPVFAEPWQAQAFALTVQLHRDGRFSWSEWAEALAEEISRAQAAGDPDDGSTYYHHWLAALERLTVERGLVSSPALAKCKSGWENAYRNTPHGKPVFLSKTSDQPD